MRKKVFILFVALIMIISACSAPGSDAAEKGNIENTPNPTTEEALVTNTPVLLTSTPIETSTITPTIVPTIISTPTPGNQFFRDDFQGTLLSGWTWENENNQRWSITEDGKLQIIGESDNLLHDEWQSNLLWYQLPEGDFNIDVHLIADPQEDFQQAAIFLYENPENYVTINRGFCGPCGGSGIYMDYKISKDWGNYHKILKETDIYLRLQSKDKVISGFYAIEPDKWIRLGRFGNYFEFTKVGLGVSNVGNESFDLVGQYDWFRITNTD